MDNLPRSPSAPEHRSCRHIFCGKIPSCIISFFFILIWRKVQSKTVRFCGFERECARACELIVEVDYLADGHLQPLCLRLNIIRGVLTAGISLVFLKKSIFIFAAKTQKQVFYETAKTTTTTTTRPLSSPQLVQVFENFLLGGQHRAQLLLTGRVQLEEERDNTCETEEPLCILTQPHAASSPVPTRPPCPSWRPRRWWRRRIAAARPGSWRAAGAAVWSPGGSGSGLQTPDGSPGRSRSRTNPQLKRAMKMCLHIHGGLILWFFFNNITWIVQIKGKHKTLK